MKSIIALLLASVSTAQPGYQAQAASTVAVSVKDGAKTINITNVEFELVNQRLLLRKTSHSKQVVGDMWEEASVKVEAWPLDAGIKSKPLYALQVSGSDARVLKSEVLQISRGLEEVEWWSLYRLENGAHLFDTYVPPVVFSISEEILTLRYAGLEVPPDDAKDARLRALNIVGVLTYASADRVISEVLITCDDPAQATLLRSYTDSSHSIRLSGPEKAGGQPAALIVLISPAFPNVGSSVVVAIPLRNDKLDLSQVVLPEGLHVNVWKRGR